MKIIGIVGSIRKDSIHRQIFNHYREISGAQFELRCESLEVKEGVSLRQSAP